MDPKLHELPPHVREALKAQATGDKDAADKSQRDYRFFISWKAPNGELFEGWFLHRAPNIGQEVGISHAIDTTCRSKNGYFIDEASQRLLIAICNLGPTLVERPKWADDLQGIVYPDLLMAVAKEATAHMRCFRGVPDPEAEVAAEPQPG